MTMYTDRTHAGRVLATRLHAYAGRPDVVVLGLPRGGVPVAAVVAEALHAPWDAFVVRKVGAPHNPELALGAVAGGGALFVNDDVVSRLGVPEDELAALVAVERAQVERREQAYGSSGAARNLQGRVPILVDDGLATGASMRVAVQVVRAAAPARVVVAVPVGPRDVCSALRAVADDVVCAEAPRRFGSVGRFYADFTQTSDDEVRALLEGRSRE
jgi:putative phosphoribosyl transferase